MRPLLAWLLTACAALAATEAKRPNILFFIMDDWGNGHAGAYGCSWVKTPHFDRVAREGLLFTNAFTPTAKCAPSRSTIMTGRYPWQLGAGANHQCIFPPEYGIFPEALTSGGYFYASTGKVWGPGSMLDAQGKRRPYAGKVYTQAKAQPATTGMTNNDYAGNFTAFLQDTRADQPWFFWAGPIEPHREYEAGTGARLGGKKTSDIDRVPGYWPDNETVRNDLLDYALEVEHADQAPVGREQRHHQLGVRSRIAGDVSGERMHVIDALGRAGARRGAADALVQRDADAGGQALERTDHKFPAVVEIEADPVEVGQGVVDQRGEVGGVGDAVGLAGQQSARLFGQRGVLFWLVAGKRRGGETHARECSSARGHDPGAAKRGTRA